MRAADEAILAMVAAAGVTVYDGEFGVQTTPDGKVVTYPLPYAVYFSSLGDEDVDEDEQRLIGISALQSVDFSFVYIGIDRNQAKWAGERIRRTLSRKRPTIAGTKPGLINISQSQQVRRDDEITRPDGEPIFFGIDDGFLPIHATSF